MKKQLAAMTIALTMAASLIVPAGTAKAETAGNAPSAMLNGSGAADFLSVAFKAAKQAAIKSVTSTKANTAKVTLAKKAAVKGSTSITYKTKEFTLQLPANWEGCYHVDEGETDGLPWYSFSDKQCYKELNGEGGWLFSIAVYKDHSYEDMPSYDVLMKKGNKIYVALYPTDVQFDGTSEKAAKSYHKLSSQIDQVLKSMKLR